MKEPDDNNSSHNKFALFKAVALVVFLVAAVVVFRFTPLKQYLTPEFLDHILKRFGVWAPVLYIVIYAAGVCLFVPGLILTGIGAILFGPYWGFIYIWLGAMAGASCAFFIGRTLGRDFATSLIGDRLKRYDDAIERNGFAVVLYLRLIYFPFTAMNFGMGLTRVRFKDYFLGTAIGIIVGTFLFTFFIGTLKEVWASGNWGELLSLKVLGSLCLFVLSFFIPVIIRKKKTKSFVSLTESQRSQR